MPTRTRLLACLALLAFVDPSWTQATQQDDHDEIETTTPTRKRGPHAIDPRACGIGRTLAPLGWRDLRGQRGQLGRVGARRGLVVALTDTTCPLTQKYAPSLKRTAEHCAEQGLAFVLLNTTEGVGRTELTTWIAEHEVEASYIHDPGGELARELGAVTTTDCFLLDRPGRLVYRGALDDQYGLGYALDAPRECFLHDAIDAMLGGRTPAVQATWAPGCVLGIESRDALDPLTWNGRISRIVRASCSGCHHTGGVAPFPLVTRADVVRKKGMVAFVLEEQIMPPWTAVPDNGPWSNDCSISAGEREALIDWLEAGLPAGDESTALAPRQEAPDEWEIGTPDLVIELTREIAVQAEGVMEYVYESIDPEFGEDRWVRAMEIRPTDRSVVHHVVVYVEAPGDDGIDESEGFLAAYVPGNAYNVLPPGFARKLRAGSKLVFEMHYTPNGVATVDRPRLGLLFADGPPEHEVKSLGIIEKDFRIPPGAPHHEVKKHIKLKHDIGVLSLMPHMHLRGHSVRIDAKRPGQSPINLLNVPAYDFNWQFAYRLVEPVFLPKDSYIQVQAWFDNSADNPANPDPGKAVEWGEQTTDEMMIGYLEYYEL